MSGHQVAFNRKPSFPYLSDFSHISSIGKNDSNQTKHFLAPSYYRVSSPSLENRSSQLDASVRSDFARNNALRSRLIKENQRLVRELSPPVCGPNVPLSPLNKERSLLRPSSPQINVISSSPFKRHSPLPRTTSQASLIMNRSTRKHRALMRSPSPSRSQALREQLQNQLQNRPSLLSPKSKGASSSILKTPLKTLDIHTLSLNSFLKQGVPLVRSPLRQQNKASLENSKFLDRKANPSAARLLNQDWVKPELEVASNKVALKAQRSLKQYKDQAQKQKSKIPSFTKLTLAKLSQELNDMSLAEVQRLPLSYIKELEKIRDEISLKLGNF